MKLVEIVFIIIVVLVLYTTLSYSKEASVKSISSLEKLGQLYSTRRKIVQRMRDLAVYKNNNTFWYKFLLLSLCSGMILTYYFTGDLETTTILIISSVIFVVLTLAGKWCRWLEQGVVNEVNVLYGMFEKPSKKKK